MRAIDGVSLRVEAGDFIVLLGPSGCGKTTLLRSVAGLEDPDRGTIQVLGQTVYSSSERLNVPPEGRNLSMIFQSYALWPHMNVFENVAYPLRTHRVAKSSIRPRVVEVLEMVGVPELERQYPGQISGGQQQRVALARALVLNTKLVLFDEPLSNVDARVREQLRDELLAMQRELRFAALYVTHDQTEALALATEIAVMEAGRVRQRGTPREIYKSPASRYVADFVGTANEIPGIVQERTSDGALIISTAFGRLRAYSQVVGIEVGDDVIVIARPENLVLERGRLLDRENEEQHAWAGEVVTSVFLGPQVQDVVAIGGDFVKVWRLDSANIAPGTEVVVRAPLPACFHVIPSEGD